MRRIYLDHGATTPVDDRVVETMLPYFDKNFGNASSLHTFGREAKEAMEAARQKVADILNASCKEIYFTAGGTESDNIAIQGIAFKHKNEGNHIITSSVEHPAVLETCHFLEKQGFEVTYLPVDIGGLISLEDLKGAITSKTILITIMHANNEIGTIQPIREIGKIARAHDILFHTDAVQSVGKVRVDVEKDNIDMLSISSHKIHGPKGIGALYLKEGVEVQPIVYGGGHERGLRASTENIPGIVGFGKACELASENFDSDVEKMRALRDMLTDGILTQIPKTTLNGHRFKRLVNNVNISFEAVEGEAMLFALDRAGIAISTGSACSSTKSEASHVLLAIGLSNFLALGSLRFTLGRENTEDEINYVLEQLPPIVSRLRAMSPFWRE
ncbi:MAG: cysteine desulfurase NifS [Candidatus Methanofastidiosia archaeon]